MSNGMIELICSVKGCNSPFRVTKGLCSRHYQQRLKGLTMEQMEAKLGASDVIPLPPSPPPNKRRCSARMKDGSRCIRAIKTKGLCSAHGQEAEDRRNFELREHPIDSKRHDYKGREQELIAAQRQAHA
jgi:hypothetical protein